MDKPHDLSYSNPHWNANNASFGYYNENRTSRRSLLSLHAKSVPSKWEDAEKWLVSLSSAHEYVQNNAEHSGHQSHFSFHSSRKSAGFTHLEKPSSVRKTASANSTENLFNKTVICENITYQGDRSTEKIDSQLSVYQAVQNPLTSKDRLLDGYPTDVFVSKGTENQKEDVSESHSEARFSNQRNAANRRRGSRKHESLISMPKPSSNARPVCMEDKGTDMTPIASQQPSRNVTPDKERKLHPFSVMSAADGEDMEVVSSFGTLYSCDDMKKFNARDIADMNSQSGDVNIPAWTSREEEDQDSSKALQTAGHEERKKKIWLNQAAAWEEAEQARYMARYRQDKLKIQAWENHQQAKAESEMRSIEIKAERMKLKAQEKLLNKLSSLQRKAEEKRAAAEARQEEHAAKAKQQAEYIRSTGRISYSFFKIPFCF